MMLSYPDSKELEGLRYPQELKEGDWYYYVNACDGKPYLAYRDHTGMLYAPFRERLWVKVPTTDGMIEGLGRICGLNRFDVVYYSSSKLTIARFSGVQGGPAIRAEVRGKGRVAGIEQALYELWKKVEK